MERKKIYERNPDTGVVRWRYEGESHEDYGWPNYGNIEEDVDKQGYTQREWDRVVDMEKFQKNMKRSKVCYKRGIVIKEEVCTNTTAQSNALWMATLLMSISIWGLVFGFIMNV